MTPERLKPGRKPAPPEQQRKVRTVRMTDARWATLQALGVAEWLEPLLDRERRRMERLQEGKR